MTQIKKFSKLVSDANLRKSVNWHPGHMMAGMKAMIGKLNTVDCVVEVHDARIPFIGRNTDFCSQLGSIKPRLLILNKQDLADLEDWKSIKERLQRNGDTNVILSSLGGIGSTNSTKKCTNILSNIVDSINNSDRYNRTDISSYKVMIVGIPNVGKSTLINRLRQHHTGIGGEAAKVGPTAGVTRHVHNMIRICSRPLIYSLDTPGVLQSGSTKNIHHAMALAACSTINDAVIDPRRLTEFILNHLNETKNDIYQFFYRLNKPTNDPTELAKAVAIKRAKERSKEEMPFEEDVILWRFIKEFRKGLFGRTIFDKSYQ